MKRMVIESIKGSFDLWINVSPRAIGGFALKESLKLMKKRNEELGIVEDKRQVNNDMHESLLNGIMNADKELLQSELSEVQVEAVIELIKENQEVVKRNKSEEIINDSNVEPKKREIKEIKIEGGQVGEFLMTMMK
jgi:hypothetical protein